MDQLKSWWEIANPHRDVRERQLPESVFAIDLGAVVNDSAPSIYQNPVDFFEKTHITQVLEDILTLVLENVEGNLSENRVQRLQTGFGGGKTHILLAIYHLLNSPEKVEKIDKVRDIVDASDVDEIPSAEASVIVGTDLDTSGGREVEDIHIKTPWGELAYQLGGKETYQLLDTSDKNRTSPGKNKLVEVLEKTSPCVILIDEILQYVLRAKGVVVGQSTLAEQTISFIDELVKAVNATEKVFTVLSLQASERYEMFGDPEAAEQVLNQIQSKVERVDTVTRPIQKEEVYSIARQRIFETVGDEENHEEIAKAYHDYYKNNSSDFPDRVTKPEYEQRIVDSYPFHPEFIDALYDQWGSMPDFQRTRGVLRFLAKVVSDQYRERNKDPLIQPSALNMGDQAVRDEALDYFEEGWDSVIGSDIAGEDSNAAQIDHQMGGVYYQKRIAQSIAASLFLFSMGGGQQLGATLERLRLGVLQPSMDVPLVADAINRCEKTFFYLKEEDGFYKFTKQPNLNSVISDYESNVEEGDKIREIRDAFPDVIGDSCFKTHIWPQDAGDVPDDHNLRLAIFHPDKGLDSGAEETMDDVKEMWENYKDEFREYRNSIVFLAPDASSISSLKEAATTKSALREVRSNQSIMNDLSEPQLEDLNERFNSAKESLPAEIRKVYSESVVPEDSNLKNISFNVSILSSDKEIDEVLQEELEEKDVLLSRLDPKLLTSDRWNIWPKKENKEGKKVDAPHITTQQLWEYFGQLSQLPMLESKEALKESIARGVDEIGVFGYANLTEEGEYENIRFQESFNAESVNISEENVIIKESRVRTEIKEREKEKEEEKKEKEVEKEDETTSTGRTGTKEKRKIETIGSEEEAETPTKGIGTVRITAKPGWEDQWDETYEAIIEPLIRQNADIDIEVSIEGCSEEGMDKSKIEREIEENLTQRNIEYKIEYGNEKSDEQS
ncbi:hypothetical protein AKJ51_03505 [candidate division MSBL1 archaeon SCGC-AAA382A20]|uniref:Uncharacterized protein n=1 Tax=candidate division MSBL1 archaeon SCGC-AAA382A20 TaxID=1698280 RepID=A0A133VJF0_9EURY|nr:hypothetical protein AKJ51_03505 [candidate division MSBL1 archaeon SCGC-AAA382A20]